MIGKNIKIFTATVFVVALILSKMVIGPVTCNSGWKSPSVGKRGACSHHGGVAKWKSSLPFFISGVTAFFFYVNFVPKAPPVRPSSRAPQPPAESRAIKPPIPPSLRKTRAPKSSVKCPKCRGPMSLRTAKRGNNPGSKFWGCRRYPRCKGTKSYDPDNSA